MDKITTLLSLSLAAAASLSAADFLPLAPGNHWTYRDAATGSTFKIEIGAQQVFLNDQVYHVLRGYMPEQLYVRTNQYGNLVYWDDERRQDILLTSFEVVPGGRFEAPRRTCQQDGQVQESRVRHEGPAGRWSALEIHYRVFGCADVGDTLEQYVENIGMVRRVVSTFAGPRTFDLVEARVGHQVISAGESGGFSVAAATEEDGTWTATLRLHQPPGSGLRLTFPSSQQYDLRLRDFSGQIVWSWSADKLFALGVHSIEVGNGWSATVKVPFPPAIPEASHRYVLEAWLTNVKEDPQFSAATVVERGEIGPVRATRARK